MPVMNEEAIRLTVLAGLMLGSRISDYSKFDRKSYFYPDMPKNYQISQFDKPLCIGGVVGIEAGGKQKQVGITRIHLEEDVAKSMHFQTTSGVDFNRAGVPLMEIVSEPELETPEEAFAPKADPEPDTASVDAVVNEGAKTTGGAEAEKTKKSKADPKK